MRTGATRHRIFAWLAAFFALVALVGVFLPWWSVSGDTEFEEQAEIIRAMMQATIGQETIPGYHEEGLYVVAALFLGFGAILASVVLPPWTSSPSAALFIGLFLILSGLIVAGVPLIHQGNGPHNPNAWLHIEYGFWVTMGAGGLASIVALIALCRAGSEARRAWAETGTFD